jgi:3-oxoacyl-[acyl-carrier protein] reductase
LSRIALITGASRGIGAAVAQRLAADGIDIVAVYLASDQAAMQVVDRCRRLGVQAEAFRADVRDQRSLVNLKKRLETSALKPDILVHCAGTAHYGLLHDCDDGVWDDLMDVHLKAAYRLTRLFASDMVWKRWGRIVYLSSIWGVIGAAGEAAYAAAKGGLNAFAKSMARELSASGVTVNAVAPGAIDTDMLSDLAAEEREALIGQIPLGRLGHPEEVAELVRFVVSERSGYMTGQVIGLNGGWTA